MKRIAVYIVLTTITLVAFASCKARSGQQEAIVEEFTEEDFEQEELDDVTFENIYDEDTLAAVDSVERLVGEVQNTSEDELLEPDEFMQDPDQKPVFNGSFDSWIASHLVYPPHCKSEGREGKVVVSFVVAKNGKVKDVTLSKSSGNESLDQEAIRVVASSPAWQPGANQGITVDVIQAATVVFSLD